MRRFRGSISAYLTHWHYREVTAHLTHPRKFGTSDEFSIRDGVSGSYCGPITCTPARGPAARHIAFLGAAAGSAPVREADATAVGTHLPGRV